VFGLIRLQLAHDRRYAIVARRPGAAGALAVDDPAKLLQQRVRVALGLQARQLVLPGLGSFLRLLSELVRLRLHLVHETHGSSPFDLAER
jgi:hypothetical protein